MFDWQKWKFYCKDYWIDSTLDKVPRIDYRKVSIEEFIQNYESKNIPVVITHATDDWRAQAHWSEEVLLLLLLLSLIMGILNIF